MPDDPRAPPGADTERTVRSALDSWERTARLCVIYLALNVPLDVLAWLIRR
jgi:hypothetical protein